MIDISPCFTEKDVEREERKEERSAIDEEGKRGEGGGETNWVN